MDRSRPDQGWRAMAMAVALFAITLNFLQPLAHAALMRDGAPSTLWTAMCLPSLLQGGDQQQDGQRPASAAASHECCLGLAHAGSFAPPPTAFVAVEPVAATAAPLLPSEQPTPVGIRDGPSQPRGPPSLV